MPVLPEKTPNQSPNPSVSDQLAELDRIQGSGRTWYGAWTKAARAARDVYSHLETLPMVDPAVGRRMIPRLRDMGMVKEALALAKRMGPLAERPAAVAEAVADCHLADGNKKAAELWFCESLLEEPSPERFKKFRDVGGVGKDVPVEEPFRQFFRGEFEEAERGFRALKKQMPQVAALGKAQEKCRHRKVALHCFCARPFTDIHINNKGHTTPCCPGWLPVSLGSVARQTIEEVWNGPVAREVRETMLDGTMRYCVAQRCPFLCKPETIAKDKVTDPEILAIMRDRPTRLKHGPRRVALNYDKSCNLACPSCRPEFIHLKGEKLEEAEEIQEHVLNEWLVDARRLKTNNAGDTFGSPLGRQLLADLKTRGNAEFQIELITNGVLFSPAQWEKIEHLQRRIVALEISVDAARPETYAVVRLGGQFDRLMANLRFLRDRRREGLIPSWHLSFVVQNLNFREMPDFVRMALDLEVDGVVFKKFIPRSWLAKDLERFKNEYGVHDPENPMHAEFLEVLKDPILKDPRVQWHSLNAFFEEVSGKGLFEDVPIPEKLDALPVRPSR
ncbi:MAG: SPASM domain-containing protein [Terrimicrobiaceae bacterium]